MQAPHGVCELSRMLSPSPYTPPTIPLSLLYIHRERGIVGGGYRGMCIAMKTATGAAVVWPRGVTTISCISYICVIVLAEPFTMSQEFSANFQNYLSFCHYF
jgi:hypothetical protein